MLGSLFSFIAEKKKKKKKTLIPTKSYIPLPSIFQFNHKLMENRFNIFTPLCL